METMKNNGKKNPLVGMTRSKRKAGVHWCLPGGALAVFWGRDLDRVNGQSSGIKIVETAFLSRFLLRLVWAPPLM